MENEKKIKRCNTGCRLLSIAGVLLALIWFVAASAFSDVIGTSAAALVLIAIILVFGFGALFLAGKANKLSSVVSGQAKVTDKHVSVGHPNEYMVLFVRDNGENFTAYGKLLYDAVSIGDCGTLATRGTAFVSFGGRTMKDFYRER